LLFHFFTILITFIIGLIYQISGQTMVIFWISVRYHQAKLSYNELMAFDILQTEKITLNHRCHRSANQNVIFWQKEWLNYDFRENISLAFNISYIIVETNLDTCRNMSYWTEFVLPNYWQCKCAVKIVYDYFHWL
jgi:hypothetical protein